MAYFYPTIVRWSNHKSISIIFNDQRFLSLSWLEIVVSVKDSKIILYIDIYIDRFEHALQKNISYLNVIFWEICLYTYWDLLMTQ